MPRELEPDPESGPPTAQMSGVQTWVLAVGTEAPVNGFQPLLAVVWEALEVSPVSLYLVQSLYSLYKVSQTVDPESAL